MSRESEQHLLSRVDEELQQALDVAPSPEFLPRVRSRAAREAAPARPWMSWLVPATAVAATLVLAWLLRPSPAPPSQAVVAARVEPRPTGPAAEPPASAVAERPARAIPKLSSPPPRAAARTTELEVLVPQGEEQLLRRFVADVRSGLVDVAAVAADPPSTESPDLTIAPLEVKPLGTDSEGVIHE